jgi:hypothetical protein
VSEECEVPTNRILDFEVGRVPVGEVVHLRVESEERNCICSRCFRIIKSKIFFLVDFNEERGKPIFQVISPTEAKPFRCSECQEEEKAGKRS